MNITFLKPEEWDEEHEIWRDAGEPWCDKCVAEMVRNGRVVEYARPAVPGDEWLYCICCSVNFCTGKKRGVE